ncbi:hypothetical protein FQA47_018829 [Oryzias melastigma]|uniref:Uncharacterized protein n=1 Tax=Oryzias melastigma TaxID=30732 RepID=A0A834CM84_ORYME|nr:hypothetical protein FQA47_018829 [Oryzias melastigma]
MQLMALWCDASSVWTLYSPEEKDEGAFSAFRPLKLKRLVIPQNPRDILENPQTRSAFQWEPHQHYRKCSLCLRRGTVEGPDQWEEVLVIGAGDSSAEAAWIGSERFCCIAPAPNAPNFEWEVDRLGPGDQGQGAEPPREGARRGLGGAYLVAVTAAGKEQRQEGAESAAVLVSPLKHQLSPPLKAAESPGSSTEEAPAVTGTARLCALDFPADILRESVFETVGGAACSAAERLHGI